MRAIPDTEPNDRIRPTFSQWDLRHENVILWRLFVNVIESRLAVGDPVPTQEFVTVAA